MNKTELESKHLAELHELAAEAGVERYRMLPRAELIEKLAGGGGGRGPKPPGGGDGERRPARRQRDRKPREGGEGRKPREGGEGRKPREGREPRRGRGSRQDREGEQRREPAPQAEPPAPEPAGTAASSPRPKRKRRRRWGRRRKGLQAHELLLPATPGRQAIVYAESRAACTALLRELAAELSSGSGGGDPIALLIDPSPEELAEWKREAPRAEIVSAGQARHADDALAQAAIRAGGGEAVVVLIDSLSRFAEEFGDPDRARELLDAGRAVEGAGSLTVVAALERQS